MDFLRASSLCCGFVGSLYVWPKERKFFTTALTDLPNAALTGTIYVDRDSDVAIFRRGLSFSTVSLASAVYLLRSQSDSLGPSTDDARLVGGSILSILVLFSGHILEEGTDIVRQVPTSRGALLRFLRDVVVAPVGEEMFFRGVMFAVLNGRSTGTKIGLSALLFSLSHAHHIVGLAAEEYHASAMESDSSCDDGGPGDAPVGTRTTRRVRGSWVAAAKTTGTILAITGVFGVLSGAYYARVCKGSILSIAAAHSLCNFLGAPQFHCLQREEEITPAWRVACGVTYVAGIVGWVWCITR